MSFSFFLENCLANPWKVGNSYVSGSPVPAIMGILNITPDSFFDGDLYASEEKAKSQSEKLIEEGALIIDVGGESSKPGATPVSAEEEIRRILPIIKHLHSLTSQKNFFISVDTTKMIVAKAALNAGAHIINDVSNLSDPEMKFLLKDSCASIVLNHRRGNFSTMQSDFKPYQNVFEETRLELLDQCQKLLDLGIPQEKICLDPGIGFGKTPENNIDLIASAENFLKDGYPLLYGMSRKSYISKIRGLEKSNRLVPSLTSAIIAALGGTTVLRVHDVKETKESLTLLEAFRNHGTIHSF